MHRLASLSGPPARTPRAGARSRRGSALRSVARRGRAAPSDRLRSACSAPLTCSVRSEPGSLPRLPLKASTVRRNGGNLKWCRTSNLPVGTMLVHPEGGRQEQRREWRGELEAPPAAGVALTAPGAVSSTTPSTTSPCPTSSEPVRCHPRRRLPQEARAHGGEGDRIRRPHLAGSTSQGPRRWTHLAGPTSQA